MGVWVASHFQYLLPAGWSPEVSSIAFSPGQVLPFAWSNCDFSKSTPTGTDVVTLLLQLLTSQTGDGTNGTYDVFEPGIGLGIPQGMINTTSFTNVLNSFDWDTAAQLFFRFSQAEDAKSFIDDELCKPFGLYLSVNNSGKITLNRPRHPQKVYIGGTNQVFPFACPAGGTFTSFAVVPIGVYTGPQLATALQNAMNGLSLISVFGGVQGLPLAPSLQSFTVTYNSSTHKFTVANSATSFDLIGAATGNPAGNYAWNTLGFTTWPGHTGVAAGATGTSSDTAVGAFGAAIPLAGGGTWTPGSVILNQGDVTDIQETTNQQDMQITRVIYEYDYDWNQDKFTSATMFSDAEAVNLGDVLGAHDWRISTKGLVSGAYPTSPASAGPQWGWWTAPGTLNTSSGGCGLQRVVPATPAISHFAVEADTWALLYSQMLLDRYKWPPLRFKCKARLGAGTDSSGKSVGTRIEVGDAVQFSYNIASVVADRELAGSTMANRVFEVIAKTDNWKSGYVDLELLGYTGNISY